MNTTIVSLIAAGLYLAVGFLLAVRLFKLPERLREAKGWLLAAGFVAVVLHGWVLDIDVVLANGYDLSFFSVMSLVAGLVVLLLLGASVFRPVENLGIVVLPLAALAVVLKVLFHEPHIVLRDAPVGLDMHVTLSILAYSILTIAAVQSILLYIQDS
ncbi:MAG: cytochrome C biogenesis protein, partial [Gammaproteobacteria bacterium]